MSGCKPVRQRSGDSSHLFLRLVFEELAQYMGPDDYVSHQSAMFLQGFITDSPEIVQVVSARRHRNRQIQGVEIRFVYRKHFSPEFVVNCSRSAAGVLIAKPALAWLDMLDDLEFAPEMEKLGELAQHLPEKTATIISMAAAISITVLKRATFYLVWCGRLQSLAKVYRNLSRSPVKLDYRREGSEILWERNLQVFFPAEILAVPIKRFAGRNPEWLLLRNSTGYMQALQRQKSLFLRNDRLAETELAALIWPTESADLSFLARWLTDLGLNFINRDIQVTGIKNIGQWLKPFAGSDAQKISLLKTAQAFSQAINRDIHVCAGILIVALATENLALVEHAIYSWGEKLFFHGKAGLLIQAFFMLEDFNYGSKTRAIVVTALVARGLLSQANMLWAGVEPKPSRRWGWIWLAEATTSHRNNNINKAKKCYLEAVKAFSKEKNQRMAIVSQVYLGNLFLGEQDYLEAGRIYDEILQTQAGRNQLSDNFQGILFGNLGIVEFRIGRFAHALNHLQKGVQLSRKVANETAAMLFLFYIASSSFYLGKFAMAFAAAVEAWDIRRQTGSGFLRAEHLSLLVAVSQIFGRFDEARYWLKMLDASNRVELQVGELAKVRGLIWRTKFNEAARLLSELSETEQKSAPQSILASRANLMLALLPIENVLVNIRPYLISGFSPGSIESFQAAVVLTVFDRPHRPDKTKLEKMFAEFNQRELFDPLWFLVYRRVADLKLSGARNYLINQYQLSPYIVRKLVAGIFSGHSATQKLIRTIRAESGPDYLYLTPKKLETITERDYSQLISYGEADQPFFYDGARGEIHCFACVARIRSSSVQARLLSYLLQRHARRVPIEAAYEVVWDSEYNEDSDVAVVKTTVVRLNRLFANHNIGVKVKIVSINRANYLDIRLPAGWQAVLPVISSD